MPAQLEAVLPTGPTESHRPHLMPEVLATEKRQHRARLHRRRSRDHPVTRKGDRRAEPAVFVVMKPRAGTDGADRGVPVVDRVREGPAIVPPVAPEGVCGPDLLQPVPEFGDDL